MRSAKIVYMMSFSRSGETLMQRHLSQSSELHIGYDLRQKDTKPEIALKRHLMKENPPSLSLSDVERFEISAKTVLAKAIWPHPSQTGFILARNPLAIVSSIAAKYTPAKAPGFAEKLSRICGYVDPTFAAMPSGDDFDSLTVKIASAWSTRMLLALETGAPVIRYEDFIQDHESVLSKLCTHLGINLTPGMISAERAFPPGLMGHGGSRLDAPVDPTRAYASVSKLSDRQREYTLAICAETMCRLGYPVQRSPND